MVEKSETRLEEKIKKIRRGPDTGKVTASILAFTWARLWEEEVEGGLAISMFLMTLPVLHTSTRGSS